MVFVASPLSTQHYGERAKLVGSDCSHHDIAEKLLVTLNNNHSPKKKKKTPIELQIILFDQ